ncbi:hypothetical protein EDB85DRAFT_1893557 [Lactarius pseudohatsudake]|nr:hypothetical protein EDB85DRAFT_1893557 [Lactarius pseudohatsudake]
MRRVIGYLVIRQRNKNKDSHNQANQQQPDDKSLPLVTVTYALNRDAPATTFAHLGATTVLSRSISELGVYPTVDPLGSKSQMLISASLIRKELESLLVGSEHYEVAAAVQKILREYRSLQDTLLPSWVWDNGSHNTVDIPPLLPPPRHHDANTQGGNSNDDGLTTTATTMTTTTIATAVMTMEMAPTTATTTARRQW